MSPLPPGEVAAQRRVRVGLRETSAPHPAFGHLLPPGRRARVVSPLRSRGEWPSGVTSPAPGRRARVVSPLPSPGEVAAQRRVRVGLRQTSAPHPAFGHLLPRGEKGQDGVTSAEPGRGRRAAAGEGWTSSDNRPSSGLRPPSPAPGRRARVVSPLPSPGEVAAQRRVRVGLRETSAPHPAFGQLLPRGEKGQDGVTSAEPGRGRRAAAGEGWTS